jgi:hypothetical protein
VPVPYFLLFLCFRKVTQEIFLELDEMKAKPPIFTEASRRPKMRRRGVTGQPHHRGARPYPWPCPPMVRAPGPPPDAAPSPIKSPRWEKPKGWISFPWNIIQAAAIVVARSGGSRSSYQQPAGEGNHTCCKFVGIIHVVFVGIRWVLVQCQVDVLSYISYVISMFFMILHTFCC